MIVGDSLVTCGIGSTCGIVGLTHLIGTTLRCAMGFEIIFNNGGVRYHTKIPKLILSKVNYAITNVPYTPMGGIRKGIGYRWNRWGYDMFSATTNWRW